MFLGIDLGTQSVKVILVNLAGEIVAKAQQSYPIHRTHPTWAEQHPHEWWAAVREAIQNLPAQFRQRVQGIGITGQMHGLVLLDEDTNVLRPAIIWMDQRSEKYLDAFNQDADKFALTGNLMSTGFAGASLLWLQDHEPTIHERIDMVLFPKDWVRFRLTGTLTTELSDASGGLFLEVIKEAWSWELLADYGIIPAQLPHLMRSVALIGMLQPHIAEELGLPPEIPVSAGAADQAAMLLGSGVLYENQGALTLGTGGQLSVVTKHPKPHPDLNLFCHAVPRRWYQMSALLAGGYALTWWQNILNKPLQAILPPAQGISAGSEGLRFLPLLNGERHDSQRSAHFIGLTTRHTEAHLTRAILEGVAFAFREGLECLHGIGLKPPELVLGGGGSQDQLWQEILASVLNLPLVIQKSAESTALGAAMLAAYGIGIFDSLDDVVEAWVKTEKIVEPRSEWVNAYAEMESGNAWLIP